MAHSMVPEHCPLLAHEKPRTPAHSRRKLHLLDTARKLTLLLGLLTTASWLLIGYHTSWTGTRPASSHPFRWSDITPTPTLTWHPCWDPSFRCARLEVPLDYTDPSNPRRVAIALTAYLPTPSTPLTATAILINPGGPGGSGINFVLSQGQRLSRISGGHPIIGFDPRGVNNTTPATTCFPDALSRHLWFARGAGRAVDEEFARSKSLGAACERLDADGAVQFVGTGNVARDMLTIVDELGGGGLRYWGFSYGTALGMTFARLFPDRVERMVLDGVVDLPDYYAGGWKRNLQDADKVISAFYEHCHGAGSSCPFTGPSPAAVEDRLRKLLDSPPIPVFPGPDWITAKDIKSAVFWSLYSPLSSFPTLAHALHALESGDAAPLATILHTPLHPPFCDVDPPTNTGIEADSAILCSDAWPGNANTSLAGFRQYVGELTNQSAIVAESWSRIQMACTGWRIAGRGVRPRLRDAPVTTRAPLLFVGNSKDPVTPVRNAVAMRRAFPRAGLLRVDGVGHCSLAAPSACVEGVLAGYFGSGEVEEGVVRCAVDAVPFGEAEGVEAWSPSAPAHWL